MDSSTLLIDLHYLPCVGYFACLLPHPTIYLEAQEHYQKQTYRNRCYILSSQRVDRLSVPTIQGHKKQCYTDLKIDYNQPWIDQHWKSISTAYRKAPYFPYLESYFQEILFQRHTYLFELNWAILEICLKILGMKKELKRTEQYIPIPHTGMKDLRYKLQPAHRLSNLTVPQGAQYHQVFGTLFMPNLSIIDLLFCEGPNACNILKYSHVEYAIND